MSKRSAFESEGTGNSLHPDVHSRLVNWVDSLGDDAGKTAEALQVVRALEVLLVPKLKQDSINTDGKNCVPGLSEKNVRDQTLNIIQKSI